MKRQWIPVLGVVMLCLLLSSCKKEEKTDEARKEVRATAVDCLAVRPSSIEDSVSVTGTLSPRYQADVKSEYAGIAEDVYVNEWVFVKKGQPLAKLDTREGEVMLRKAVVAVDVAKAGLAQAKVGEQRAEREFKRAVKLRESGLMTQQGLDEAQTAKDAASAAVVATETQIAAMEEEVRHARTRLEKAIIRAPLDGVVAFRGCNKGDFVGEMGSPKVMFQIVNNQLLDLNVVVPSHEISHVKVGQSLTFTTDALPGQRFEGKLKHVNPSVNPADRTVTVMAEVRNRPEVLKGGLFIRGRIITGSRKNALSLPRASLMEWDMAAQTAYVMIADGEKARKRVVGTGAVWDDGVEIVSGLSTGDRVIARGAFSVKDGDPITVTSTSGF